MCPESCSESKNSYVQEKLFFFKKGENRENKSANINNVKTLEERKRYPRTTDHQLAMSLVKAKVLSSRSPFPTAHGPFQLGVLKFPTLTKISQSLTLHISTQCHLSIFIRVQLGHPQPSYSSIIIIFHKAVTYTLWKIKYDVIVFSPSTDTQKLPGVFNIKSS